MVDGVAAITVEGDTSWLMNATIRQDTNTAVLIKISRTEFLLDSIQCWQFIPRALFGVTAAQGDRFFPAAHPVLSDWPNRGLE